MSKSNYVFEKGIVYTKVGRSSNESLNEFIDNIFKLEVVDDHSLFLPVTNFNEKFARNLISSARRRYSRNVKNTDSKKEKLPELVFVYSKVYDNKKKYLGTRIWRKV